MSKDINDLTEPDSSFSSSMDYTTNDNSMSRNQSGHPAFETFTPDRNQSVGPTRNKTASSQTRRSFTMQQQHQGFSPADTGKCHSHGKCPSEFTEHAAGVMRLLHGMWETRHMCDMVINVNGTSLPVHRLALAACSDTFKAKLCTEQPIDIKEVFVSNSTPEAAEAVLRYIYTLELSLDEGNVDPVLSCALQLGISSVVEACKSFLLQFNLGNAMKFIGIAEKHQLLDVISQIHGFICVHFLDISLSSEFLHYDLDTLCRVLAEDCLVVGSELDVFYAVQRWIEHNVEERLVFASTLMKLVRMLLISPEELALHVEPSQYIFQIPECHEILFSAFRYHALTLSDSYLSNTFQPPKQRRITPPSKHVSGNGTQVPVKHENKSSNCAHDTAVLPVSRPAAPRGSGSVKVPIIMTVGGLNPAELCTNRVSRRINEYNPRTNSWAAIATLPDKRHHQGAVLLNKELYIIGGSAVEKTDAGMTGHQNPTNTCYKFDRASHSWHQVPSMKYKRVYHSVVVFDENIYALGGLDEQGKSLNSVECFDISSNKWKTLPSMSEARTAATAVAYQEKVFIVGGFTETAMYRKPLCSVGCYDPCRRCWTEKRPFPIQCAHACAVVASDRLFLIGGATFEHGDSPVLSLSTVYLYMSDCDRWRYFTNLHVPRHSATAVSIGNHIYVMGGLNTANNLVLSSVECLDIANGSWVMEIKDLPQPALGLTACVDSDAEEC